MTLEIELPELEEAADLAPNKSIKQYAQYLADACFSRPRNIACTVMVVVACVGVIVWNLQRLAVIDQLVLLEVEEYRLGDELSDLELRMSRMDMVELKLEIQRQSDQVFQGFPQLAAWAEKLASTARREGIELSYRVRSTRLSPVPDVLEVPVTLEFKAPASTAANLFSGSMRLLGEILRDQWHIDVVSTRARGDGDNLQSMHVDAEVWVRDRYGFVDMRSVSEEQSVQVDIE